MRERLLRLFAAAGAAVVLLAGSATAGSAGLIDDGPVDSPVTQLLPTDVDPLLSDTAVTDSEIAVAGVWVDSLPSILSDPNHLVVDDDLAQCPEAQFQTINAAVLAAPPGARIRVCPGAYHESVRILKPGLVLQAPRHQGQATECKSPVAADPTRVAVVRYNAALNGGNPSVGFQVEADDITIEGFTIEPDESLVTHDGVAIFTDRFHAGHLIKHNVVQRNTFGIYVNSNGSAPTTVSHNCVRDNNLGGANSGIGIYSDQGLRDAEIQNNYLTGHESGAIIIDTFLGRPSDLEITHNSSIDDGAIGVFNSDRVNVSYNEVVNSVGSGITTFSVTELQIHTNHLSVGNFNGISLNDATRTLVKSNKVTGFRLNGIRVGTQSNGNTIESNRSENNVMAGLRVTEQSSENVLRTNHMRGNTPDCYDDTAGPHTAATANHWINNSGLTQNRPGLCKKATP